MFYQPEELILEELWQAGYKYRTTIPKSDVTQAGRHGMVEKLHLSWHLAAPEALLLRDCFLYLGGIQELQDPQAA